MKDKIKFSKNKKMKKDKMYLNNCLKKFLKMSNKINNRINFKKVNLFKVQENLK